MSLPCMDDLCTERWCASAPFIDNYEGSIHSKQDLGQIVSLGSYSNRYK